MDEDFFTGGDKSAPENWLAMKKWIDDSKIKIHFRDSNITIMLMPADKRSPHIECKRWKEINLFLSERVGPKFFKPLF